MNDRFYRRMSMNVYAPHKGNIIAAILSLRRHSRGVRHMRWLTLITGFCVVAMVIFWQRVQKIDMREVPKAEAKGMPTGLQRYIKELENSVEKENASYNGSENSEVSKVRLLCLIFTTEARFHVRAEAVNVTWARRCHRHFFVFQTNMKRPDIISTAFQERRRNSMHKLKYALNYVYQNHIQEFDWLLRADDDTYVITQNLQFLLSHYNSSEPGYLGLQFQMFGDNDFMNTEDGFVMSNRGIRRLIEFGLNVDLEDIDLKALTDLGSYGLKEIRWYLNISAVPVLTSVDSEDNFNSTRNHLDIFGSLPAYSLSWPRDGQRTVSGSQYSVTFHYMKPEQILIVDYLLYKTSVYDREPAHNVNSIT